MAQLWESYLSLQTDFEFPTPKLHFMLTITKISKNINFIALTEPTSVSTEPSVSHAETSQ